MTHPTAIVTGAGSGIGRATALRLAAMGHRLTLVGRTESKLRETAKLIAGCHGPAVAQRRQIRAQTNEHGPGSQDSARPVASDVLILPADLSDPKSCQQVIEQTVDAFGRLDALCNIAGLAAMASIGRTEPKLWDQILTANLHAAAYLTHFAWPVFDRQKSGFIANVSSMASIDPFPGFSAYATAKAGLNMFTRITASEGEPIGLRAVGIAPGAVETPMLRALFDEKAIAPHAALDPDKVAQLICDCLTGHRVFKNGQTLTIIP